MNAAYELYHYGILGMKWGIRRYQDENGNLTEEGKRRYASGSAKQDYQKLAFDNYRNKDQKIDGSIDENHIREYFDENGKLTDKGRDYFYTEDHTNIYGVKYNESSMNFVLNDEFKKEMLNKCGPIAREAKALYAAGRNYFEAYKDAEDDAYRDKLFKKAKEYNKKGASKFEQFRTALKAEIEKSGFTDMPLYFLPPYKEQTYNNLNNTLIDEIYADMRYDIVNNRLK